MDASHYKDYVPTLRFMKYVADKYAGFPDALIDAESLPIGSNLTASTPFLPQGGSTT